MAMKEPIANAVSCISFTIINLKEPENAWFFAKLISKIVLLYMGDALANQIIGDMILRILHAKLHLKQCTVAPP